MRSTLAECFETSRRLIHKRNSSLIIVAHLNQLFRRERYCHVPLLTFALTSDRLEHHFIATSSPPLIIVDLNSSGPTDLIDMSPDQSEFQIAYDDLLSPDGNQILFITGDHTIWAYESGFQIDPNNISGTCTS